MRPEAEGVVGGWRAEGWPHRFRRPLTPQSPAAPALVMDVFDDWETFFAAVDEMNDWER